ncbi:MAG: hypothetical protein AAGJ83_09530 [Planctomycetota bacterium]
MKRLALAIAVAVSAMMAADNASANHPSGYPFFPFGFYQPYGAQYTSSIRTPPYFATNPPVYYGARHARPYGMSPFAAPPMVSAGDDYRGRLRSNFHLPASEYELPVPAPLTAPAAVPCHPTCDSRTVPVTKIAAKTGKVQINPFAAQARVAKN